MRRRLFGRALRRTIQTLRIAYYRLISDNAPSCENVGLLQPMFCTGRGQIVLRGCHIGVQPSPRLWEGYCHLEAREASASIEIDADVWLNNGATLIAERTRIRVGRGCLIGPGVQIFDSDFHSLDSGQRQSGTHPCRPVVIEENVLIGASVTVLKGVTVGRNSVVAAGAVVTSDVPSDSIVAGVPARVVQRLQAASSSVAKAFDCAS
jgi:maltose O-acetyltransferase